MEHGAGLNRSQVADLVQAAPQVLQGALQDLPDWVLKWHPAPDEWCINEVIGHLLEADRRGFDGRIRLILERENPDLEGWAPDAVAAARGDCDKDGRELLAELAARRRESVDLISGLTEADLQRSGRHPRVGTLQVSELLFEWVHHDMRHTKQILSNLQRLVWPQMGNAQRFSEIS